MNKTLTILAPISVLVFIVILAVMYGWVGTMDTTMGGETPERPELNTAANQTQLINNPTFQAGVGNGQIQLINKPTFQAGVGNGQIQLINKPTFPAGVGNGQIQLINKPTFPAGVGNGQIQLINKPTFPAGVGNGQIQLINQIVQGSPYLGMGLADVPAALSQELNLKAGVGVYVKSVTVASPAEKAGVKSGDVILKFDGKNAATHQQIGDILKTKKVGSVIKIVINRNGKKKSFHIKLESAPNIPDTAVSAPNNIQTQQNGVQQNNGQAQQNGSTQQTSPKNPFEPPPATSKIWMGADIQDIDAVMQLQFSLPDTRGVIVSHVSENSPAITAGLQTGDVIRRFNDTRIRDVNQFQSLILKSQPGNQIQLTVLRKGSQITLPLLLGEQTPTPEKPPFLGPADIAIEGTWIGMDVGELTGNGAADLGLPAGTKGILVNDVESPPATMLGFTTGDVIVAVNGQPTPDMKNFETATQKQTSAVVDVIRGNKHLFISVPPPGFTQQGTKINQAIDNKIKQVAMTQQVVQPQQTIQPCPIQQPQTQQGMQQQPNIKSVPQRFGIFASTPDLNSTVYGNRFQTPYLIMVDLTNNSFAVVDPPNIGNIADTFSSNNLSALLCSDISQQTASDLSAKGVTIYAGVVGTPDRAIDSYKSGSLTPVKGL
ncbi:MAG: PDZ domain-containing protein [Desulfamplus sp.]|nr:PDZ domain-containing protein [Desulfamplus sp.]